MKTYQELNQIDLKVVIAAMGQNARLSPGSSQSHISQTWIVNGEKFVINMRKQAWYKNSENRGATGAVLFVQNALGVDYYGARDFLESLTGNAGPEILPSYSAFSRLNEQDESIPPIVEFDEAYWPRVRAYLTDTNIGRNVPNNPRCLSQKLIDYLHDAGQIGAAIYTGTNKETGKEFTCVNAIFRRERGGAFVRGVSRNSLHKSTIGNKSGGCFIVNSKFQTGVAYVEAPVDAISLHQLHPELTVIAVGGGLISTQAALKHADANYRIFAAFDSDKPGNDYANKMLALRPDSIRLLPHDKCKDWNKVLQVQFGRVL